MRLQIDWASLIVGSKFNVFVLFYFVFEGNFPSTSPRRTYIWTGLGGLYLEGLIHGGAYFRNFTVYAYYARKFEHYACSVILKTTALCLLCWKSSIMLD